MRLFYFRCQSCDEIRTAGCYIRIDPQCGGLLVQIPEGEYLRQFDRMPAEIAETVQVKKEFL